MLADYEFVQRVVAQIPWRTNRALLDKLDTQESRIWYAQMVIANGWSSNVLGFQIQNRLMERSGKNVNNFTVTWPEELKSSLPSVEEIEKELDQQ